MRLISWNVLADSYIRTSLYPRSDNDLLVRGRRIPLIIDHIEADQADVFCLQEVEPELMELASRRLGGWSLHFEQKRGKPDGCAILGRPHVLIEHVAPLVFSDGPPDRADSGHVAAVASVRTEAFVLQLITTHLRWDPPGTPPERRWAVREVRELLTHLRAPAIVCGDLNIEPSDIVYHLLIDAGLVDAGARANRPTANPNGRAKRIDYFFHSEALGAQLLVQHSVDHESVLPSRPMPSDHVPIALQLEPRLSVRHRDTTGP